MDEGGGKRRAVIAGAGPAGSSLAIRLAVSGWDVTLIERETFPRHKLCGEFISPECLRHFGELGALDLMLAGGGAHVSETRFHSLRGVSFSVPSSFLDTKGFALSLSRAEMDERLLRRAREAGVRVLEGTKIAAVAVRGGRAWSVEAVDGRQDRIDVAADVFVDATGRSSALVRLAERALRSPGKEKRNARGSIATGFKAHFSNVRICPGTCEIFFFPGGYGGLTAVEGGLVNLCFLIDTAAARKLGGVPERIVREALMKNPLASRALAAATLEGEWHAVSISEFGRKSESTVDNVFSVGDAAAFIDPFTGSGMLMALESSALLAPAIAAAPGDPAAAKRAYRLAHERKFSKRLLVCSMLRRAAFLPFVPSLAISFLALSRTSRELLAGSTRSSGTAGGEIG